MDYTHLGRSGLKISRLALGTMNFGPVTDEATSHGIMDAARDRGINFFDTANDYGRHTGKGRTEEIIGSWFAQGGTRRERTVLATKVYADMGDWPNEGKLSALNIRRSLDASLARLQTDYVDLLQFHHVDRNTPWEEIWQAVDVAITQGKIVYAGSSNFAAWHIASAQASARERNLLGLVSEQSFYNLFTRAIEREVIPAVTHYGLGLLTWSPLNQGLLGGVLTSAAGGHRRLEGRAAAALETHRDQIQRYEDLADRIGVAPSELALAWLLDRPAVTAPVIGPRTIQQLDSAVAALRIELEPAVRDELDAIFPPFRESPEDYAW